MTRRLFLMARRARSVRRPALILAALAAPFLNSAARADELQHQLLAGARATRPDGYAFRRTIAIERTGAARRVIVEQFDPRRPPAERWSLVGIDGRAPTAKEAERSAKAKHGPVPSYAELADWIGAPATRVDIAPGHVLYRFASLPKGAVMLGSHDASADMRAEATVDATGRVPFVEHVRLTSVRGFRMMLVASLSGMTVEGRYRLLADGGIVPGDATSRITGSLMGKSGELRTATSYADIRRVR